MNLMRCFLNSIPQYKPSEKQVKIGENKRKTYGKIEF